MMEALYWIRALALAMMFGLAAIASTPGREEGAVTAMLITAGIAAATVLIEWAIETRETRYIKY